MKLITGTFFFTAVGPIAFALLLASYLATGSLQILGNYFTMFRWSKTFCFGRPIVHVSLLQDYLRSSTFLGLSDKIETAMTQIFLRALSDDVSIVNQKNALHGDTCLHVAIDSNNFDLVEKMIISGGNLSLNNNYGENVLSLLQERKETSKDETERDRIANILVLVDSFNSTKEMTEKSGVNSTNILQAHFFVKVFCTDFYLITVWFCIFLSKEYHWKSCS